jgi:hypothetical protein
LTLSLQDFLLAPRRGGIFIRAEEEEEEELPPVPVCCARRARTRRMDGARHKTHNKKNRQLMEDLRFQ